MINPCYITGTFQWYKLVWSLVCVDVGGGMMECHYEWVPTAISGATSVMYEVTAAGTYWCEIDCGSGAYETDRVEYVYYSVGPTVNVHPEPAPSICLGEPLTLSISASNAFKYQWQRKLSGGDWSSISGATSNQYTTTPDASYDQARFRCLVSNGCESSVPSNEALLDINFPPSVTTHPVSVDPCEGTSTNFSIAATGDGISYQWQKSENHGGIWTDQNTSGKYTITGNQMSISDISADMDDLYFRCVVSGTCSPPAPSNHAILTVRTKPSITSSPTGGAYCTGDNITLSVTAEGTEPFEYFWRKDDVGLHGMWTDSTTIHIKSVTTDDEGAYDVLVRNVCFTPGVESFNANVTVKVPPSVDNQANPDPVCQGDPSVQFSVTASGDNISYQWQMSDNGGTNWSDLSNNGTYSGATLSTMNISNPTGDMDGQLFRCRVHGDCSPDAYSTEALLTVYVPPSIDMAPQPVTVCLGADITLSVSVSGTTPLYLWRKDGISLTGWISSSTYTILGAGESDAGAYDVLVKNVCTDPSSIESDDATVTVNIPPSISIQPQDKTLCEGSQPSVVFSTSVPGSGLSYQWEASTDNQQSWTDLENNITFSGVTTDELTVSSTDDSLDQYVFRCKIIGVCEPPVTTDAATLTIKTGPEFISHPQAAEICEGENVTFSVDVSGTEPFQYLWREGEASLGEWSTENTYTLYSATLADNKNFDVIVKNQCNASGVESEDAQLVVNPKPYVSLGNDRHICTGESTLLDPGGGYSSYSWSTEETTQTIEVSEQGSYEVTVTDAKGCKNSDNIYIILDPVLPEIDLGPDMKYCLGTDVILDAGSGYDEYSWQNGSTSQTFNVYETGQYHVTASNNNTVCIASDTVDIFFAEPYDKEEICLVGVDLETGKNMVIWERHEDLNTAFYKIYRETTTGGVYDVLNTIPYNKIGVYVDSTSEPEVKTHKYRISVVDTCGNESDPSPWHKTMLLTSSLGTDRINLNWSEYETEGGFLGFVKYIIYRGPSPDALKPIDSIPSDNTIYPDIDPPAGENYYRVAGVKADTCFPTGDLKAGTGPFSHSLSNVEENRLQVPDENQAPTDLSIDNTSINENEAVNALVGRFTTTDPDVGDSHVYEFVSGTGDNDNSSFTIKGDSLLAAEVFDYETKSLYSIRVSTTDTGNISFEKQITVFINDVTELPANLAPTDISIGNASVDENEPAGSLVGRFTTTDPDAGDTHTYSLVSGTGSDDNANFGILGDSLLTAEAFDYETKSSYSVRIRTTDDGTGNLSFEKAFSVTVNDVIETGIDGLNGSYLKIYPNPFRDEAIVEFPNPGNLNFKIRLMDITGNIIRSASTSDSRYILKRLGLNAGVYILEVKGEWILRGRLIVE